jgi:CHASE2 domain-containing sensor protein
MLSLAPLTSNLFADSGLADILIGGASAYDMWNKANHWAAFMASGVLGFCFLSIGKMQPTPHKFYAWARGFIIIVAGSFCIILILHEWWPVVIIIVDFFIMIFTTIFEFSKELTSDLYEYISDL